MGQNIIDKMNEALAYELRAINMYAHYAANIKGIHRIQLGQHFDKEVDESMLHSKIVRSAIVKLGGICVTERSSSKIVHTENYKEMLQHSLETEMTASKIYRELLEIIKQLDDTELYDSIENIYFSEVRSVEETRMLID